MAFAERKERRVGGKKRKEKKRKKNSIAAELQRVNALSPSRYSRFCVAMSDSSPLGWKITVSLFPVIPLFRSIRAKRRKSYLAERISPPYRRKIYFGGGIRMEGR